MFFRKKEPKVEFVSLVDGLEKIMPITKTTPKDYEWMKKAQEDFKSKKHLFNNPTDSQIHILRCPGIFEVLKTGWVQKAWQDITIQTNGDEYGFGWKTPLDQKVLSDSPSVLDYVGSHEDLVQRYTNDFRNLKNIIKIQTPWVAYVPKGYSLLVTPIPYPDHTDFEAAIGILPSINGGPITISPQLKWYCKNDTKLIKAGTPLHQLFLLKNDDIPFEVRSATQSDKDNMNLAIMGEHNRFVKRFANLKTMVWK
jgi:hypothetical protein